MNRWQRALHCLRKAIGRRRFGAEYTSDFPDRAQPDFVYLIGEGQEPWIAVFQCPCGCGELIQLSLMSDARPHWRARAQWDGTVTLSPSIWRIKGCRSHFFIQRGLVEWAGN